jgi:superfamily I DNA and RNA helicase
MTEFMKTVERMRAAQTSYFKTSHGPKKQEYLILSKDLEKQVDNLIKDIKSVEADGKQHKLFL